ncbi:C40 family peptidase [Nocardia sp. CA2R105]|nr:C40 family peptidase [Nocardia coffeae]
MSESQLRLARDGVAVGKQHGEPSWVIIAELAAQATESTLRNLANPAVPASLGYANDGLGYDHDSVGPHQMRASVWGGAGMASLMNPLYQIKWFYQQADKVADRNRQSSAGLAQAVERSAPDVYSGQLDLARRLYAQFADINVATMTSAPGQLLTGCGSDGSGAPVSGNGGTFGAATIAAAQRWIGTPYVWGGGDTSGPGPSGGGFDCSGLTLYAVFQASGGRIRLPHYTQSQQDAPQGRAVPFSQRQPGDLIFFTSVGERDSHHVAIYLGRDADGHDLVLHAPTTGKNVRVASLAAVAGTDRLDVRRYSSTPAPPIEPSQQEGKQL